MRLPPYHINRLHSFNPRNKRSIAVNLKHNAGVKIVEELCNRADVFIEPYRPGVMEKLGLGPQHCLAANPRLVYARLTGFGQTGPLAHRAGHDINYLAISGVLSVSLCPDFLLDCYPEAPGVVSQTSSGFFATLLLESRVLSVFCIIIPQHKRVVHVLCKGFRLSEA